MGYRSEVAYVIEFDDVDIKEKWVALAKLHPTHSVALKECNFVDDMTTTCITAYFSHVKWYESFDDVKAHTHMLESLQDGDADVDKGINARFVRIGEDADDCVDEAYGDGNGYDIELYISRVIDTPYSLSEKYHD